MTQNPSLDVVRPSIDTKKSRPLRPPFWDVGRDKSEGLNRRIEYKHQHTIHIISPPSMPKLRGFQQGLYGYVDVLSISENLMQPQLLPGTLTFLVYEDEEVPKECLPWNVLSNSVLSFARGIASEDLDRPNAWRHHESETNVQTEDVQATHWMHSMTAHTRGIVWKMIESRSHGWRCCFRKQLLSNFVSSKRPFPRCKRLSLPKGLTHRCPPRRQRVICPTPQGHLSTTGSETFPGTTSRQLNLFSMMMLNTSLDPKPNAINGPQCKIWRTWPWLCSFNTSSATFPVQWDSSFCGRMVEKYSRWRHPSESV